MTDVYVKSVTLMGTVVTIEVVGHGDDARQAAAREEAVERAFGWFHAVEARCSRFEPDSEVSRLARRAGEAVPVHELVYTAVEHALAIAADTGGAFDPTVGLDMERRGFNREYRTGRVVHTDLGVQSSSPASYRDVQLDPARRAIVLQQPLLLDLGAVAKGLAVDLAARELRPFGDYAIDAGGDLYLAGRNPDGRPWQIGIRHPRKPERLVETLRVSGAAVCTSGDYERQAGRPGAHHVLDPQTRAPATELASVTVVAPTAMSADALATAAFVLGPRRGLALLERHGVDGLMMSPSLERFETRGFSGDSDLSRREAAISGGAAILPDA